MNDLLTRLLALAELAVSEALQFEYGDPEDRHIWRELQELKLLVQQALEQPESKGATDDELLEVAAKALGYKSIPSDETCLTAEAGELLAYARAVLARWGRPAIKPVPVAERPWEREGWCDAQGKCWWWNSATNTLGTPWWSYEPWEWVEDATHCLPHHALPVPQP